MLYWNLEFLLIRLVIFIDRNYHTPTYMLTYHYWNLVATTISHSLKTPLHGLLQKQERPCCETATSIIAPLHDNTPRLLAISAVALLHSQ